MSATRIITNAWEVRTLPDIFYEEKEPVEDGMRQYLTISRIAHLLLERYEDRPDVFISGGVFISYDINNGNRRVGPDLLLAFDVNGAGIRENLPNYWIWEVGKGPDFVLEVASPSTAEHDLGWKRELYQRLGIQEYWRFDPTGGRLYGRAMMGERLVDGEYEEYPLEHGSDGSERSYSELLEVVFYWDGGQQFDALDPATGLTIDKRAATESRAIVAETELSLEREARAAAEARADREREARAVAEARVRELEKQLHATEDC